MGSWNCIEDMFAALQNADCKYIILRNYEEIDEENFYTPGHADIDFLTSDYKKFSKIIKACPRFVEDDGIHYKVNINDTEVIIDVRTVGDGYYDKRWQKSLLEKRQNFDGRFFIADAENYYYTLIYHAILQKENLSEEYLYRLNQMAKRLGSDADTEAKHLKALEQFMKENKYFYTIPYDIWVPLKMEKINRIMVKKYINVYRRDFKIKIWKIGSKVKHRLIGH